MQLKKSYLIPAILLMFVWIQACGASRTVVSGADETAKAESAKESEAPAAAQEETKVPAPESEKTDDVAQNAENVPEADPAAAVANSSENAENAAPENPARDEEVPAGFFECEAKISLISSLYTARGIGPSLEEARENTIDEACAIPCAEQIADKQFSDDEAESALDACTSVCTDDASVLAVACWQNKVSVYTEGEWNENGDPAPTNGGDISDE